MQLEADCQIHASFAEVRQLLPHETGIWQSHLSRCTESTKEPFVLRHERVVHVLFDRKNAVRWLRIMISDNDQDIRFQRLPASICGFVDSDEINGEEDISDACQRKQI